MAAMSGCKRLLFYASLLSAVASLAGCRKDISGGYLASDQHSVVWLQVIRTADNHLTGSLASSTLKADGTVEQNSLAITGAVNGENVTLTGNGILNLQAVNLAGTIEGDTLTLTGTQAIPVTLKRSTLSDYQAQVAALNAHAQSILKAKADADAQRRAAEAQANFIAAVNGLINRMTEFDSDADVHLGRFSGAEKTYEAITAKVSDCVARERQLSGNPNPSVARSQLSVAATQASLMTDQVHFQAQSLETSLQTNVQPMVNQAAAFEQRCQTLSDQQYADACDRLNGAAVPFRQKFDAMSSGLAHLERVYQRERSTQQQLLQTAEQLQ
jgi:hypothetical protein